MKKGTPLKDIADIDVIHVLALRDLWITTAEELIAVVRTPGGERSVADHLGISAEGLMNVVQKARKRVPAGVLEDLERDDGREFGMGALKPEGD